MSKENVDLFKECIEGFNRMDIAGLLRLMDPEIRFDHRLSELEGSHSGLESVQELFSDVVEHFDGLTVDCPDIRDLGDRALGLGTTRITGKGSGLETELPFTVIATYWRTECERGPGGPRRNQGEGALRPSGPS